MSSTQAQPRTRRQNPIPPWNRLAVDAATAAQMMGCGRSTFFARVKAGAYPKAANDGLWNVSDLAACRAKLTTMS